IQVIADLAVAEEDFPQGVINKLEILEEEAAQLESWLVPVAQMLSKVGNKGAPFKTRVLAVKAVQSRLTETPRPSWTKFAIKHCQCEKPPHDQQCGKRIYVQAVALKHFLKDRNIHVPGFTDTPSNPVEKSS